MNMETRLVENDPAALDTPASGERRSPAALLGQGAVLVWNDVAEEGREQFYEWHDKEHIPERLAIPGFRRGRRFSRPGHSPEWLTMYEADDLSVVTSPEYLTRLNVPTSATISALKHFRNTARGVCRVVCSVGSSTGGHMLAMRLSVPGPESEAMCRFLCDEAFPKVMALTGVVACHLYAADHSASHVNTAESSTRDFDVPSWVVLCEATTHGAADKARELIDGPELRLLRVVVRNDAAVYELEICRLSPFAWRR
jgi:hypothetical protein